MIKNVKSRDSLFITGDFNAKAGTVLEKRRANSNGYNLFELEKSQSSKLTNTFFKHKQCHRSNWESPIKIGQTQNISRSFICIKITQMLPCTSQDHTVECAQNQIINSS